MTSSDKIWLEEAKKLSVGGSMRMNHGCGSSSSPSLSVRHDLKKYWAFCYKCKESYYQEKGNLSLAQIKELKDLENLSSSKVELPEGLSMDDPDVPLDARMWLYQAGIRNSEIREFGIYYNPIIKRVVMPVRSDDGTLIWLQQRLIFEHKGVDQAKYLQPSASRDHVFFRRRAKTSSAKCVVVCEDILSTIKVGRFIDAVSLLGTATSDRVMRELSNYSRVFIWLDDDAAGKQEAKKLARSLSLVTDVTDIRRETRTTADPKLIDHFQIESILTQAIERTT